MGKPERAESEQNVIPQMKTSTELRIKTGRVRLSTHLATGTGGEVLLRASWSELATRLTATVILGGKVAK